MRIGCTLLFLTTIAQAQSSQRNEVSFSGGVVNGQQPNLSQNETAVGLGATYSYRAWRYVHLDAGLFAALSPSPEQRSANFSITPNDHFYWATFGPRIVLPSRNDRLELSLGAGGVHENYSVNSAYSFIGFTPRSGWGGYFTGGAAVAIDHGRHLWLGFQPRFFMVNSDHAHDRWFFLAGQVSYRF